MTGLLLSSGFMSGCGYSAQSQAQNLLTPNSRKPIAFTASTIHPPVDPTLLKLSWEAYRQRFIHKNGRVIEWESNARSTSKGQAYAMLRSVFMDDPKTFELTMTWAEKNLRRDDQPSDTLWAWKWGRYSPKQWGILDPNFASDADIDAITALILASRRWQRPDYLSLAQSKLQDLWKLAIVSADNQLYLLPGPREAFQQSTKLILNPSYFSPAAFRLFAQVDQRHDWLSLVDSSYQILEKSATLSTLKLPSDWLALDTETKQFQALLGTEPMFSRYGADAYRVWWRITLDAIYYNEPRAKSYLQRHLKALQEMWRSQQKIPAQLELQGKPTATIEATSHYGALYMAFRLIDPPLAEEIYQKKIMPRYNQGLWDNDSAYYTQNLVGLGLMPSNTLAVALLKPAKFGYLTRQ